jgi:Mor family transcriptional regulator
MRPRQFQSAATILPDGLITAIQQHCDGCWLYIPKQRPHARLKRRVQIIAFHTQGMKTAEIARRVDCSARYVRMVVANECRQTSSGGSDADE